ncbi:hypothetical protein BH11PLA1_BH11PLA1_07490 [soil metagenome]
MSITAPLTEAPVVAGAPCAQCGYDISNLPLTAACPECNFPVRESRWPGPLVRLVILRRTWLLRAAACEFVGLLFTPVLVEGRLLPTFGVALTLTASGYCIYRATGIPRWQRVLVLASSVVLGGSALAINFLQENFLYVAVFLMVTGAAALAVRLLLIAIIGQAVKQAASTLSSCSRATYFVVTSALVGIATLALVLMQLSSLWLPWPAAMSLLSASEDFFPVLRIIYWLWYAHALCFWAARIYELTKINAFLAAAQSTRTASQPTPTPPPPPPPPPPC